MVIVSCRRRYDDETESGGRDDRAAGVATTPRRFPILRINRSTRRLESSTISIDTCRWVIPAGLLLLVVVGSTSDASFEDGLFIQRVSSNSSTRDFALSRSKIMESVGAVVVVVVVVVAVACWFDMAAVRVDNNTCGFDGGKFCC